MPDRSDTSRVNGMELIFRETLRSDIEGLFSVRARTRENPISKEQLASLGITAESIAKQMASGRLKGWVCLDSSTLVGFCSGDAETGEVLVLAVLPDYEGRGIGTNLLSRVVVWFRSVGSHICGWRRHRTREYERMAADATSDDLSLQVVPPRSRGSRRWPVHSGESHRRFYARPTG